MRDLSRQPDLRLVANLEWLEKRALLVVVVIAAASLSMSIFPAFAVFIPAGWPSMKVSTSCGMLLAVASLTLSVTPGSRRARRVGTFLALALAAMGLLSLLSYAGVIPFDIVTELRRPSPQTSFCFILLGLNMALLRWTKSWLSVMVDVVTILLITMVLFVLGGSIFQVLEIIGVDADNVTSPQSLLCLIILTFTVAARRAAEGGLLAFLVNIGIGSQIARLMLPGVVAGPFVVFAAIGVLNRFGILPVDAGRAIAPPIIALAVLGLVAAMGRRANALERQLRRQSLTDQLTNVLNRRGFEAVAEYFMRNAQRTKSGLIAFYFDLDGLKRANDVIGHDAGSTMIRQFADLLVASFRKSDVVARIGGDEFVVLTDGRTGSAASMLARLKQNVVSFNAAQPAPLNIHYSAGFAELLPGNSSDIDALLGSADAMMYEEKKRKKTG